jgi:hypothetical protein
MTDIGQQRNTPAKRSVSKNPVGDGHRERIGTNGGGKETTVNKSKMILVSGILAAVCIAALLPLMAQTTAKMPARDLLMPLKRALEAAGAPVLTATQETQLNGLIAEFRTANAPQPPSAAKQAARLAYESAILAGDPVALAKQVGIIVSDDSALETARMTAIANFAITALKVLGNNSDQTKLLQKQFGNQGVVRIIESLVGGPGPGGARGRMGGPGMGFPGGAMQGRGMGMGMAVRRP